MLTQNVLSLLLFAVLMSIGQVLFKVTASKLPEGAGYDKLIGMLQIPQFWMALLLYGASTILWIFILQYFSLSRAYVFVALAFILVPALSVLFLGETITTRFAFGTVLIVLGVYISATA